MAFARAVGPPASRIARSMAASRMTLTLALPKSVVNRCSLIFAGAQRAMAKSPEVGSRIREALTKAGLKPVDLARKLSVSQPTVHGWLNNTHGITWENARRVGRLLNVPPGWIMFGADKEAQSMAQTPEEMAFLTMFRDADDDGQAAVLKYLTVLSRPPPNPRN